MMYQICPATIHDIPVIQELTNIIWPATYLPILSQEQLDYMISWMYSTAELTQQMQGGYTYFLLKDQEQAIGFAAYSPMEDAGVFKLHKIYLHPDYQGKGAGKFLINAVMEAVKRDGAQVLELNVNKYNKARYFYEKIGFDICAEKDIDIGNGYFMNDLIMRRVL